MVIDKKLKGRLKWKEEVGFRNVPGFKLPSNMQALTCHSVDSRAYFRECKQLTALLSPSNFAETI